ncbi:hypothetical protein Tco_0274022 [Tanacetum coccineum]
MLRIREESGVAERVSRLRDPAIGFHRTHFHQITSATLASNPPGFPFSCRTARMGRTILPAMSPAGPHLPDKSRDRVFLAQARAVNRGTSELVREYDEEGVEEEEERYEGASGDDGLDNERLRVLGLGGGRRVM